jgi:mannose-6-phosphate isomerase-like protein (cupin superfamily)
MAAVGLVIRADEVEPFTLPHLRGVCESQGLVDPDGVGSQRLVVNRFTLRAGQSLNGTAHPPGDDECYYVLSGRATLTLGGDPATGAGAERHELSPDTTVFIPGGTFHSLDNPHADDLIILTIWPSQPAPGSQPFWDGRRREWGTTFKKRDA